MEYFSFIVYLKKQTKSSHDCIMEYFSCIVYLKKQTKGSGFYVPSLGGYGRSHPKHKNYDYDQILPTIKSTDPQQKHICSNLL
jgi:hypothetical protein